MARIAVVDDSAMMRHLLSQFLEQQGHEVHAWEEGPAEGIPAKVQELDPDLLITDYLMPICDGLTLARQARSAKPGLPVILLTADHDPGLEAALGSGEVSLIIHKPLHTEELLTALKALL